MPNSRPDNSHDSGTSHGSENSHGSESEPAEPLNREQRRAQRRGKKPPALSPGERVQAPGHREQVVVPRRSGRRGNR